MTWIDFAVRLLVGFFLGVGIGIERQWLKSRAVLKTNVLVTLGAAMFVMLSIMTPNDASPTRVASQVVSGVGFLGGGVILREGASVRGINTAATLWCAAAIGTLVGSGYLVQAYLGTFAVVGANLLLRPLVAAFKQPDMEPEMRSPQPFPRSLKETNHSNSVFKNHTKPQKLENSNSESVLSPIKTELNPPSVTIKKSSPRYCCYLFCQAEDEAKVLAVLLKFAREQQWSLKSIRSNNLTTQHEESSTEVEIKAEFDAQNSQHQLEDLEAAVGLFKSEAKVKCVSWQQLMVENI